MTNSPVGNRCEVTPNSLSTEHWVATSSSSGMPRNRTVPSARIDAARIGNEAFFEPLIRTLLALGTRAEVKYYRTVVVATEGDRAVVDYWYTVTYTDDDGKKKTFLAGVLLERLATKNESLSPWRVKKFTAGFDPFKGS